MAYEVLVGEEVLLVTGSEQVLLWASHLAAPSGPKTGMRRGLPKAPRAELEVTRGGAPAMGLAGH